MKDMPSKPQLLSVAPNCPDQKWQKHSKIDCPLDEKDPTLVTSNYMAGSGKKTFPLLGSRSALQQAKKAQTATDGPINTKLFV